MKYLIALVLLCSCDFMKKDNGDEMEKLGQDVLKKGQGLEFDIKPLPKD